MRHRRRIARRPAVTAGLDFTRPAAELIDEVTERLMDRYIEDHTSPHIPDEALERIYEKADEMVTRRLR